MDQSYFDQYTDRTAASGTYSLKWEGFESRFPGYDVSGSLPMWVADTDFRSPPQVIDAVVERARHGIFGYTSPIATARFVEAASGWCGRRYGWEPDPGWGLYFPGVVCAINAAIQEFTAPGEGVIIQPPVYYPFFDGIVNNGRRVVKNPLILEGEHYRMDFAGLEKAAASPDVRLLILCSPHNPVGRVWTPEELRRLAEICLANNVLIFSDEIHGDLVYSGHRHTPTGLAEPRILDSLIAAYAPSKTFNLAGMTSSVVFVPNEELRKRLAARFLANRLPKGNAFGQIAGETAYRQCDDYADALVTYLEGNLDHMIQYGNKYFPEVRIRRPEGTYLVWLDFRGLGLAPQEANHFVLEKACIAADLGIWFGEGGEGFARVNIACPRSVLTQALERLRAAVEDWRAQKG